MIDVSSVLKFKLIMNIGSILNQGFKKLSCSNIRNANLDCELLLSKIINKDREYVVLNLKENIDKNILIFFMI